jgi:hypothetical protein
MARRRVSAFDERPTTVEVHGDTTVRFTGALSERKTDASSEQSELARGGESIEHLI